MKVNHINLTVDDVASARQLFERHFDLRPIGEPVKNFAVLIDEDNFLLTLMGSGPSHAVAYPRTFHIGFVQPSKERVNELHRELAADGYEVEEPRQDDHAWAFHVKAPGGFTIEISRLDRAAELPS